MPASSRTKAAGPQAGTLADLLEVGTGGGPAARHSRDGYAQGTMPRIASAFASKLFAVSTLSFLPDCART